MKIDFNTIEGPVYTGRDRGEKLRTMLNLDSCDVKADQMEIIIPDSTYSISSSFFLGLFGPSVVLAGSRERFYSRYTFKANDFILGIVDGYVGRALQRRNLFAN